ncbi:MAG TPA: DUF3800 domain-containing protein [Terriglobales bacterium]|nr:DUF3800 domain-containing protein [Terriglobales bacterium]
MLCAKSQFIPIAKIAKAAGISKGIVVVLTFKFDESYNNRTLCVGGWLALASEWTRLENQWKKRIDHQNKVMPENKRISRFHAANLNCYDHEFKNWSKDDSKLLTGKLLEIIQRRNLVAISCGIRIDDFFEVFNENNPKTDTGVVYALCMKQVMIELGHALDELPDHKILIIHDHGNWDNEALQAYNSMVDDPRWQSRDRFAGITPGRWEHIIGLQAADLIAYETFKHLDNRLFVKGAQVRYALRTMLSSLPLFAKYFDREVLTALKKLIDENKEATLTNIIPERGQDDP